MTPTPTSALPVNLGDGPLAVITQGLVKRYGPLTALNGVDLQLPEHTVYVLVGPNGAGKSTLFRTLMGLARRHAGAVNVLGADPALEGATVREDIGYVPEDHRFGYSWMTVSRLL
jgi:ABC-2 type transport system ATP-binding protein